MSRERGDQPLTPNVFGVLKESPIVQELPTDILSIVFRHIHPKDFFTLRATSHFFNVLFINFMLDILFKSHKKEFVTHLNHLLEHHSDGARNIKIDYLMDAVQNPSLSTMGRVNGLLIIARRKEAKLEIPDDLFTLIYKRMNENHVQTKESAIGVMSYIIPFLSAKHCEKALEGLVEQVLDGNDIPIQSKPLNALKCVIPRIDTQSISFLFNYINRKLEGEFFISQDKLLTIMAMIGDRLDATQVDKAFNKITAKFINHSHPHINKKGIEVLTAMASRLSESQVTQFMGIIGSKLTKKKREAIGTKTVLGDALLALSELLSAPQIESFSAQLLDLLHRKTDNTIRASLLCYLITLYPYLKSDSALVSLIRTELPAVFNYWYIIHVLPEYLVNSSSIELLMSLAIDESEKHQNKEVIPFLLQMTPKAPTSCRSKLEKLAQQELVSPSCSNELIVRACAFHEIQLEANQVIKLIKDQFGSFRYFTYLYRVNVKRLFSILNPTARSEVISFLEKELDQMEGFSVSRAFNALTLMTSLLTEQQFNLLLQKATLKLNNRNWDVRESVLQFFTASASRFTQDQVLTYLNYGLAALKEYCSPVCKTALHLIGTLIPRVSDVSLLNLIYKKVTPLLGDNNDGVRQEAVKLLSSLTCKNIGSLEPMQTHYSEYTLMQILQNMWKQIIDVKPNSRVGSGFFDKDSERLCSATPCADLQVNSNAPSS